jgi:acid phosphatase
MQVDYMRNGTNFLRFAFLLSVVLVQLLNTTVAESLESLTPTCDDTIPELSRDRLSGVDMVPGAVGNGTVGVSTKTYEYRYPQLPLDVDGYPIAPEGLKLEQVHIYVRHGACS